MLVWTRRIAITVTMAAVCLQGGLALSGAASSAPAAAATTTEYAVDEPVCPQQPPAGQATCLAIRRVRVSETTPGAKPFVPGAGAATTGPAGGLTPSDLATAYNVSSTATGTGQTVAIVDAYNDPNINSDLQTFDTNYGLATCSTSDSCLTVVNQTGGSTPPADDTTGWSVEESLDVETVHSMCQNCKIILVEANSNSTSDLANAEDEAVALGANEVTNSFGGPETADSAYESYYNHPGTVITASAGDDGYYDYQEFAATNQANFPASSNTVVAVGGTSLFLNQNGTRSYETVWNDNGPKEYADEALGASGGGCSTVFSAPSWQTTLSDWGSTACGGNRLDNDVSADADPITGFDIYDSYNCDGDCTPPSWATYGGTSLSSPIIASIFALAGGAQGASYPAATLYAHLGTSSLNDVTAGGDGWCDGEGAAQCGNPNALGDGILDCDYPASGSTPNPGDLACDAATGYDGPTGVGTPNGLGAFEATGGSELVSGALLNAGGSIFSPNGSYRLSIQPDGNLVEYNASNAVTWASNTAGHSGDHVIMQSDGNLVVYSSSGTVLFATNTAGNPGAYLSLGDNGDLVVDSTATEPLWAATGLLVSGALLNDGSSITTPGASYRLSMQPDGNLVEYNESNAVMWASNTAGDSGDHVIMQSDGNLVVYSSSRDPVFATNTAGNPGAYLYLGDNGGLVVYSTSGAALWTAP